MSKYKINGGGKYEGEVKISGSKNAALPIIAATILNSGKTTLYNVPKIQDTEMMYEILTQVGANVIQKANKVIIDTSNINKFEIPSELMKKMRSSIIFAGAFIGKHRKVSFSYPGGCDIGTRPIDLHLKAFEKIGINIMKNYGNIVCSCDKIKAQEIDLDFPSVGATENIILASCLAEGKTVITNSAKEPEIVDLQKFLNAMGAKITGAGTDKIEIQGVKKLKDVSYNIMPDRIETGTFLCLAGMTNSKLTLKNIKPTHIIPIIHKLEEANCKLSVNTNNIIIEGPKRLKPLNIKTMPYPGFPTDMQSVFGAILTIAKGTSIISENIFENRYKYMRRVNKNGSKSNYRRKNSSYKRCEKIS